MDPPHGKQSLERCALAFLDLYLVVHCNDFCVLFRTSLSSKTRVHLPGVEPLGTFKEYMEWVLLHNYYAFTICKSEEENSIPVTTPAMDESESESLCVEMSGLCSVFLWFVHVAFVLVFLPFNYHVYWFGYTCDSFHWLV